MTDEPTSDQIRQIAVALLDLYAAAKSEINDAPDDADDFPAPLTEIVAGETAAELARLGAFKAWFDVIEDDTAEHGFRLEKHVDLEPLTGAVALLLQRLVDQVRIATSETEAEIISATRIALNDGIEGGE